MGSIAATTRIHKQAWYIQLSAEPVCKEVSSFAWSSRWCLLSQACLSICPAGAA